MTGSLARAIAQGGEHDAVAETIRRRIRRYLTDIGQAVMSMTEPRVPGRKKAATEPHREQLCTVVGSSGG
jgi:hypothetical protein